jgi:geranyl-CoA carboxylase alpha subunit
VFAARRHDGRVGLRAPALRADSVRSSLLTLQCGAHARTLRVQGERDGHFSVTDHRVTLLAHGDSPHGAAPHGGRLDALIDGQRASVWAVWSPGRPAPTPACLHLVRDSATFAFTEPSPWPDQTRAQDPARALAPVAGTVVQVLVQAGERVQAGQPLLSIEAMKMEMWLHAQADGTVDAVHTRVGALVQADALLVALAPDPTN